MRSILFPLLCLLLVLSPCIMDAQNTSDDVKQIIIKKYERMRTSIVSGDPNYVLNMHAKDAILFLPNGTEVVGISALQPFYEKIALTGIDIKSTPTSVQLLSESIAFEIGVFTSTSKSGSKNSAKYINIWKKIDGDWKLYKAIDQAKL